MPDNLFAHLPAATNAEEFSELLARPGLTIERIVSTGQASPPDLWYDQEEGEWVAVLQGAALLRFADEPEPRRLGPGDWVDIAPHRRHRVEWTDPEQVTVWLAVHYALPSSWLCLHPRRLAILGRQPRRRPPMPGP